MRLICGIISLSLPGLLTAQAPLDANAVLDRAIAYHDPAGRWSTFARTLVFRETRPNGEVRSVSVSIDKPNERFVYERNDGRGFRGELHRETCLAFVNGDSALTVAEAEGYGLACDQIKRRRNYYQYLWGLPMKLRDEGTIVAPEVKRIQYQGREVLAVDVTYDASVGTDTWHFYFHPDTFRLVGYRFNHDEALNDGEYIVLDDEYVLDDMRIPKIRKWYRNANDEFLGTDVLMAHRRVTYAW